MAARVVLPPSGTTCASQCRRCSLDLSKKVQADLFLQPNKDGLFPGFTQTWRAER